MSTGLIRTAAGAAAIGFAAGVALMATHPPQQRTPAAQPKPISAEFDGRELLCFSGSNRKALK